MYFRRQVCFRALCALPGVFTPSISEPSVSSVANRSIDHAAKMKEAQLKDKPERREWEAAPSFFKWTCGNYDQVQAARDCEDYSAKLATAQSFRQAGNELFVEEKFEDALMKYACTPTELACGFGWLTEQNPGRRLLCHAGILMLLLSSTGFTGAMGGLWMM